MIKSDLVSVIVNCRNGEEFLETSINSILNQSYKNFEIIFFDNNSTDQSLEIIKKINSEKIKIYQSKKLLKLYNARNLAISKSRGKYITFLDVDDSWEVSKLEKQIEIIKKDLSDVVYTNFWVINKKKKIFSSKTLPSKNLHIKFLKEYPICISSVMIKSYIFKDLKIFFNDFYEIIGDFDLMYKLSNNFKFSVIQEPLINYLDHKKNTSKIKLYQRTVEMDMWIDNFKKKYANENYNLDNIIEKNLYFKCKYFIDNNDHFQYLENYNKKKKIYEKIKLNIYKILKKLK